MANAVQSDVLGKFVWYDQMSNDLPGSEKFYSKVVGWDLAPNTMNAQKYTLLKVGDNMVGGLMPIPESSRTRLLVPASILLLMKSINSFACAVPSFHSMPA